MYELKKIGKVYTSKFVGTGPSSCEKKNLPACGPTKLRNTVVQENNRCSLWQQYGTHKHTTRTECKIPSVKPTGTFSNMGTDIV